MCSVLYQNYQLTFEDISIWISLRGVRNLVCSSVNSQVILIIKVPVRLPLSTKLPHNPFIMHVLTSDGRDHSGKKEKKTNKHAITAQLGQCRSTFYFCDLIVFGFVVGNHFGVEINFPIFLFVSCQYIFLTWNLK